MDILELMDDHHDMCVMLKDSAGMDYVKPNELGAIAVQLMIVNAINRLTETILEGVPHDEEF